MLAKGRIDGFLASNVVFDAYSKMGIPDSDIPSEWLEGMDTALLIEESPVYLSVSKQNENHAANQGMISAMEDMIGAGKISEIYGAFGVRTGGKCTMN